MQPPRKPPQNPVIIIPSRMNSTRLPGKPLADIQGRPMIVHVLERATRAGLGPVVVACDGREITEVVEKAGGRAVLTRPDHARGSDRIWEALNALEDGEKFDAVINVQGDEPTLDPQSIRTAYALLQNPDVDIATLAAEIRDAAKKSLNQVVKAIVDAAPGAKSGRALYFTRLPAPAGEGPMYHHIGLYAYRRDALARYASAAPSPLEIRESLEQLRALSIGMHIEVGIIDAVPLGVDTPQDLDMARKILGTAP